MRLPLSAHQEHPWLIRELASDFDLDEVWDFPIEADESKGETFAAFMAMQEEQENQSVGGVAELLFKLREVMGKMGLDGETKPRPIPGCTETSLKERLKPEDVPNQDIDGRFDFKLVYQKDNERAVELSNSTVHAALHMGWVHKGGTIYTPRMAVYVKPRGAFGKLYMSAIYPFRVVLVYPQIVRVTAKRFEERRQAGTIPKV